MAGAAARVCGRAERERARDKPGSKHTQQKHENVELPWESLNSQQLTISFLPRKHMSQFQLKAIGFAMPGVGAKD
jgi:hypothetical protein